MGSFPDYLVIQMRKFYVSNDWIPKKMDVFIEVPQEMNIEYLRGTGLKSNEVLLPESDTPVSKEPGLSLNSYFIIQLRN